MGSIETTKKRITETAVVPTRGSLQAAGYDLYADIANPVVIAPHCTAMIGTGLTMEIPEGYFGAIFARSGLDSKKGLRPANCVGLVDSDYRGEIKVALHNDTAEEKQVAPNEKGPQIVIMPLLSVEFEEADALDETARGEGGFGSTGSR